MMKKWLSKKVPQNGKSQRKQGKFVPAPTKTWKQFEREIAAMFSDSSIRNPLSGRNSATDSGERRAGDVIIPEFNELGIDCLVECKYYRTNAVVKRAEETRKEAEELGKSDWLHLERRNGNKKIYVLACSEERMKQVCQFLMEKMIDEKYGKEDDHRCETSN